jgi:hypothetical protein
MRSRWAEVALSLLLCDKSLFREPLMNPAEKSIATLRREVAVVGSCAVACFLAATAVGLAAQLKLMNPGLSNALFQLFLVCGLVALGHSQLASRVWAIAQTLSAAVVDAKTSE